ncbi:MAG: 50S ribosomal protein L4 [Rikenellaceae bacterium]
MELKVKNIKGEETGAVVTLAESVFGIEPKDHAIYLDVKQYLAAQRQGTHKSKQRAEIAGSTKKLKRQKGTGGARCGSIKSPIFVGGGRVFGPVPRDYDFKLNKKLKQLARRSALSYKAQGEVITVVDSLQLEDVKTKSFLAAVKNLGLEGKKLLIVSHESEPTMVLASRNVQKVKVVNAASLNTYDIMNCAAMLVSTPAVEAINAQLSKEQ